MGVFSKPSAILLGLFVYTTGGTACFSLTALVAYMIGILSGPAITGAIVTGAIIGFIGGAIDIAFVNGLPEVKE